MANIPHDRPGRPLDLCIVDGIRLFAGAEIGLLDAAIGLRERGRRIGFVAAPGGELARRARAAGFPVGEIAIRFDAAPWTLLRLIVLLRRWRPRAVLCNQLKDLKAAGVAARLVGVPVVLQTRESDFPLRRGRPYYRWYYNRVATGVVVNSRATLATTLRSAPWLSPDRVHLLYKGIDTERFRPRPLPEVPTVGFAGRLDERKGLPVLLDAWQRIERLRWPVPPRLRIAGDGPLSGAVRAWRAGLAHPEAVELVGWCDDMPSFHASTTLLAVPSRYEGFGLSAAEAMACGRPVVASRASSLPEIVVHDRTGLLVPPGAAVPLARALTRLLADPALCGRLGAAGRERIVRRFSRTAMLDRLDALLHDPGTGKGGSP